MVLSVGACDSSSSDELDDIELNDQLEQVITLNGQRRLANFVLPESDDFGSIPQYPRNPLTSEKVFYTLKIRPTATFLDINHLFLQEEYPFSTRRNHDDAAFEKRIITPCA